MVLLELDLDNFTPMESDAVTAIPTFYQRRKFGNGRRFHVWCKLRRFLIL